MGGDKVKALCVATRCTTMEQFVGTFCRYCDEKSFFVATMAMRPVGLETPFSIQLADRTPVLRGTCVVLEAFQTGANPFKRPGIRLGIQRLTPDSEQVFNQLQGARAAAPLVPITDAASAPAEAPGPLPTPAIPRPPAPAISRVGTAKNVVAKQTGVIAIPPKPQEVEVKVIEVVLPIDALPPDGPTKENPLMAPPRPVFKLGQEERTAHSELILPANPLMNLTDESIEGFVDCCLYEETATFFPIGELSFGIENPRDPVVEPPPPVAAPEVLPPTFRPKRVTMNPMPAAMRGVEIHGEQSQSGILRVDQSGMLRLEPQNASRVEMHTEQSGILRIDQSGILRVDGAEHSGMLRVDQSGMLRIEPPLPAGSVADPSGYLVEPTGQLHVDGSGILRVEPTGQMPPIPRARGFTGQIQPMRSVPPTTEIPRFLADEQVHTPVPAGEQFMRPGRRTSRMSIVGALRDRRTLVIGGAAAATLLVVIIGFAVSGGSSETHAATTPPPVVVARAQKPVAPVAKMEAPPPKPADPKPQVDASQVDPGADGVVGEGPCKLEVKTTPAGSMVAIDGRVVGPSPITIGGPCDNHKVELSHPRYKSETRFVQLVQDKPGDLDVTLMRPTHNVKILSSPPGADVFIAGRPAGSTPTMVQLMGFSGIDIKIARVGFKTVTKRFYSKTAEDKFYVSLDPQRVKPTK